MIRPRVGPHWETDQEEEKNAPSGRVSHRKQESGRADQGAADGCLL